MSTESALLAAIAAAPDDDLPRLVYADWLDERNLPRGEFIRIAVELARHKPGTADHKALMRREIVLLAAHPELVEAMEQRAVLMGRSLPDTNWSAAFACLRPQQGVELRAETQEAMTPERVLTALEQRAKRDFAARMRPENLREGRQRSNIEVRLTRIHQALLEINEVFPRGFCLDTHINVNTDRIEGPNTAERHRQVMEIFHGATQQLLKLFEHSEPIHSLTLQGAITENMIHAIPQGAKLYKFTLNASHFAIQTEEPHSLNAHRDPGHAWISQERQDAQDIAVTGFVSRMPHLHTLRLENIHYRHETHLGYSIRQALTPEHHLKRIEITYGGYMGASAHQACNETAQTLLKCGGLKDTELVIPNTGLDGATRKALKQHNKEATRVRKAEEDAKTKELAMKNAETAMGAAETAKRSAVDAVRDGLSGGGEFSGGIGGYPI